jgi:hypothetical protein
MTGAGTIPVFSAISLTQVPEPATLGLLAVVVPALLTQRRRNG